MEKVVKLTEVRRNAAPTLAGLLADPARVAELPPDAIPAVLGELEAARVALWALLMRESAGTGKREASVAAPASRLLTASQVSERLGLPQWSVYELARRRVPPAVRLGRRVRFRAENVEAYLAEHRTEAAEG